jgi:hypothetical protein
LQNTLAPSPLGHSDAEPAPFRSARSIYRSLFLQAWWLRVTASLFVAVIGLALSVALGAVLWRCASHNEGVVVTGEVYRAAQLNDNDLRSEIQTYHLKSVLNLRGENPKADWYVRELATCREMGVVHADVRLSARHLPRADKLAQLIGYYHSLPQPMLIHCNAGSDRTGFAGAIYLIECKGVAPVEATRALTWEFGHFPIYPYFEMNEFFELFENENPLHHSFSQWAVRDYPEIYAYEETETEWHEMLEPLESLAGIPYWRQPKSPLDSAVAGKKLSPVVAAGPAITAE